MGMQLHYQSRNGNQIGFIAQSEAERHFGRDNVLNVVNGKVCASINRKAVLTMQDDEGMIFESCR